MLTTSHIEKVLAHYDLGELKQVTHAGEGNVNETVFIQTTYGRFVLRRNQQQMSERAHRHRHSLIAHLYEHNFPVPALIPTRDGETMLKLDGSLYEVQIFVEGKDFNPDQPQQLERIGMTLAHYHCLVQGFAQPMQQTAPRYNPRCVLGMTERLMECDVMGDLWPSLAWYDARAAQLRTALREETYSYLPHCLIHGDMHSGNMRFMGNEVAALLDYDQVSWDARIVDLADALVSFATDGSYANQMLWGVFRGPLDEQRAARLLAGYVAVTPLQPQEIALLPKLIELIWLQGELGRVSSTLEGSVEYHLDVMGQWRWLSEWMRSHNDQLVQHWTALNVAPREREAVPLAA